MKRTRSSTVLVFLMLLTALLLSSCRDSQGQVYRVWIDHPEQGDQFNSGDSIPILVHVAEQENLAEIIIRIGDEVLFRGSPPESDSPLFTLKQEWSPDETGEYTIQVDVIDDEGLTMQRSQVDISVIEGMEILKPDLTITDITLVGADKIRCHYANLGGAVLPEGRDVWMDIILGPAESELPPVSRSNIGTGSSFPPGTSGSLTTTSISPVPSWPHLVTCRIDVDGQVTESDEDNNNLALTLDTTLPAPPPPATTEPPPPTTEAPPPTTQAPPPTITPTSDASPPSISGLTHTPGRIAVLPCGQNTVTISVQVSDPSGISLVRLFYRAVDGGTEGSWQSLDMIHEGGSSYTVDVGPAEISASYDPYGGMNLEYYVEARDSLGNTGESSRGSVPLDPCVQ